MVSANLARNFAPQPCARDDMHNRFFSLYVTKKMRSLPAVCCHCLPTLQLR
jgi:hypothetical protein